MYSLRSSAMHRVYDSSAPGEQDPSAWMVHSTYHPSVSFRYARTHRSRMGSDEGVGSVLAPPAGICTSASASAFAIAAGAPMRSEEHTSELQSLMRNSYAVFCLKKKIRKKKQQSIK